jgi:hypothetical protein
MWHQHGRIPEENEGVFVHVGPIPDNYQEVVMARTSSMQDLSEALGFSGVGTKLGRIASKKTISEAVVAVPFVEDQGRKKFFKLNKEKIKAYLSGGEGGAQLKNMYDKMTNGEPSERIGPTVTMQIEKMKKFIFPPSFDFVNFDVDPVAMYVFEFTHDLSQQDLSDIWQNLPPDIGQTMETAEVAITHPLLKKELLGDGGDSGNNTIEMPEKLKWMVFKVKQRAASNYFKKTVLRNSLVNTAIESSNASQDEFGATSALQYNWPYDFFSLVEMVRLDAEVEMGNTDFSNYISAIPDWNAVQADRDKIGYVVGGLEDEPMAEITIPEYKDVSGMNINVGLGITKAESKLDLSNLTYSEDNSVNEAREKAKDKDEIFEKIRTTFISEYERKYNLNSSSTSLQVANPKEDALKSSEIKVGVLNSTNFSFNPTVTYGTRIQQVSNYSSTNSVLSVFKEQWLADYTNYYDEEG